jgi:hypothetical protein
VPTNFQFHYLQALVDAGFRVVRGSHPLRDGWIVEHRFQPVARLVDAVNPAATLDWPATNLVIAGTPDALRPGRLDSGQSARRIVREPPV